MAVPVRLGLTALALVAVFAGAFTLGRAVAPAEPATPTPPTTPRPTTHQSITPHPTGHAAAGAVPR